MSRREFRPKRWEQKANVRPGKRARMYRYTQYDLDVSYERGIIRGTMDTAERNRRRDDLIRRLSDAAEQGQEALENLAEELDAEEERRWWSDDLTGVADAAGVLDDRYAEGYADGLSRGLSDEEDKALWDSVPPAGEGVVVEIEQWLQDRGRWLDFLREHGDLPDEQDGGE